MKNVSPSNSKSESFIILDKFLDDVCKMFQIEHKE